MNRLENPIGWESDTNCWSSVVASCINTLGSNVDHRYTGKEIAQLLGNNFSSDQLLINTAFIFNQELQAHRINYAIGITYATKQSIRELILDATNQNNFLSMPVSGDSWVKNILQIAGSKEQIDDHAILVYGSEETSSGLIIHLMDPASEKNTTVTFDELYACCRFQEPTVDGAEYRYLYGNFSQTPVGEDPVGGIRFTGNEDLIMQMILDAQNANIDLPYKVIQKRDTGLY